MDTFGGEPVDGGLRVRLGGRALSLLAVGALITLGIAIGGYRHDKAALAVAGLIAAVPLALALARFLDVALIGWIAVSGLAYPFMRYPPKHDQLTFDRVAFTGFALALILLVVTRHRAPARPLAQWLGATFALFVLVYGVRAVSTHQLPPAPGYAPFARYELELDWFDRAALPLIAFLVALRIGVLPVWERMVRATAILGLTVAVLGLAEWIFGFQLATLSHHTPFYDPYAHVTRVSGPYGDPTTYGGVLIVCIAVTCYWVRCSKTARARLLPIAILALDVLALAPSYTKTVWIAGLVTLVVGLGVSRRLGRRLAIVGAVVAGGVALAYLVTRNSAAVAERVTGSTANFWGRIGDYHQGILIFKRWPLFGAGFDQFISAQQQVRQIEVNGVSAAQSAHNTFISVLAESGLLGFIPLFALTVLICVVVYRTWRQARTDSEEMFAVCLVAATVGTALMSTTLLVSAYPPVLTLYSVFVGVAAARLRAQDGRR